MRRKTFADWDQPIMAGFPVGLYMHNIGANRKQRRATRSRSDRKAGITPTGSMTPAIKRKIMKRIPVSGTIERNVNAPDKGHINYIEVPTGKVEYVSAN